MDENFANQDQNLPQDIFLTTNQDVLTYGSNYPILDTSNMDMYWIGASNMYMDWSEATGKYDGHINNDTGVFPGKKKKKKSEKQKERVRQYKKKMRKLKNKTKSDNISEQSNPDNIHDSGHASDASYEPGPRTETSTFDLPEIAIEHIPVSTLRADADIFVPRGLKSTDLPKSFENVSTLNADARPFVPGVKMCTVPAIEEVFVPTVEAEPVVVEAKSPDVVKSFESVQTPSSLSSMSLFTIVGLHKSISAPSISVGIASSEPEPALRSTSDISVPSARVSENIASQKHQSSESTELDDNSLPQTIHDNFSNNEVFGILGIYAESSLHCEFDKNVGFAEGSTENSGYIYFSLSNI